MPEVKENNLSNSVVTTAKKKRKISTKKSKLLITEAMIAEAAYFKAKERGFDPGNEMQDWIEAEIELAAKFEHSN